MPVRTCRIIGGTATVILDLQPHIVVQEAEYKRLLGYPRPYVMTGRARELADWARDWYAQNGSPRIYARKVDSLHLTEDGFSIDGVSFSTGYVRQQLLDAQAQDAMLVAVSAGPECEAYARQLWQEEKPDEYFFLEVYGSTVVEHLITMAGHHFCAWADQRGLAMLPHYSPGYPGWQISDQPQLWGLIQQQMPAEWDSKVQVLDSGMLQPKKSLLALLGITAQVEQVGRLTELIPCDRCALQACQYRRVPYKHTQPRIEDISRLQTWVPGNSNNEAVLHDKADYSVSTRVLRRWAQERLQLRVCPDRSIEARFRYEGTTCSNMGRALVFDYHLTLDSAAYQYRILNAACTPAPGNDGYMAMCKYLTDTESLMEAIETEKPFWGKPLNDILNWERPFSPAGCYCNPASRTHKWGLVLEVIHYALVQVEKQQDLENVEEPIVMEIQQ
jgi:hypothetical protein